MSVVLAATPAEAHARVLRTTPASGATTGGRIALVTVVFDDPVTVVPHSLVLSGATGAPQPIGAPRVVGGKTLQATVPGRLPAGRYFVGWRILSDDGHIESGTFGFAVVAAGAAPAPNTGVGQPPQAPMPTPPTWPTIVAAVMAAIAVLGGALVVWRGLPAVRLAGGAVPYPSDALDAVSTHEHAPMRR
jgi:copper resistance protein C